MDKKRNKSLLKVAPRKHGQEKHDKDFGKMKKKALDEDLEFEETNDEVSEDFQDYNEIDDSEDFSYDIEELEEEEDYSF